MSDQAIHTPGSLVFIRAGATFRRIGEEFHTVVSHRMMTYPCLVLGVSCYLTEVGDRVGRVHTVMLPQEGIVRVSGADLITQEEMLTLVHVRYGTGPYIPFTWPRK